MWTATSTSAGITSDAAEHAAAVRARPRRSARRSLTTAAYRAGEQQIDDPCGIGQRPAERHRIDDHAPEQQRRAEEVRVLEDVDPRVLDRGVVERRPVPEID